VGDATCVGFAVLYRWRIRQGKEAEFSQLWLRGSKLLKEHGSMGARLHKGADGVWYSYAQWPDSESRDRAFAATSNEEAARALQACIEEKLPEILLHPVADCLGPDAIELAEAKRSAG
jgi:hypothetical protein